MNWQYFVKNLLDQLKVADAMENSFKNWHVDGVNYLNLLRTKELTVKIYMFPESIQTANKAYNVIVNPHTHVYNFHTILLNGGLDNLVFEYHKNAHQPNGPKKINQNFTTHNRFSYVSALRDQENAGFKFEDIGHITLKRVIELRKMGDAFYSDHGDIHSVKPVGETMILQLQYNDLPGVNAIDFFTQSENPPSSDKLYQKFNESEIVNLMNRVDAMCAQKPE